ncbi:hypothetical protein [Anaerocolumna chitinilytica]|uniref:Uncharacterized protein n=1 Tax=Anaerocolumna chitinilytica TaxID=1727145 RepID=A0A7I8DIW5_9FIRM|nr:hypothetical protein [Anaerocolumna chitinilytica]BCJ98379.1 hypothetical protein bsdcttw_14200 [Anaerocolumna chitinilytica]
MRYIYDEVAGIGFFGTCAVLVLILLVNPTKYKRSIWIVLFMVAAFIFDIIWFFILLLNAIY